ncbi:MAG: CPBP family intramembrane metalloprotease [Bacteroidales bacterium]|nr:CPBP family intramembrane metalloprotease [Bacteroidales bacterium]
MKKYFLEMGFWGRLFVFLTLTVFLMLGAVVVGDILAVLIYGKDAMVAMEVPVVQFLQTFLSIGLFLLPPVFMVRLCCEGSLGDNLMVSKPPRLLPLLVCIAAMVVSEPMVSWLEEVNMRMTLPESMSALENWMREREQSAADIIRKLTESPDTLNYVTNLGVLALLPGLCEEMFFRVGVQTRLFGDKTRIRGVWAVVLTAVLFSALHLQFFGFLPRMVLGVVLGMFLLITGNVWYSIAAHFVNNMIAVTLGCGSDVQQPQWMETWWAVLISAVATVAMLWLLWRIEKKSKNALKFREMV